MKKLLRYFTPGDGQSIVLGTGNGVPRSHGHSAPLVFGPYISLPPGRYSVEYFGQLHSFGSRGVKFEVVAPDPLVNGLVEMAHLTKGSLQSGKLAVVNFTVYEETDLIEFRVMPSDGADVSISSISLNALPLERSNTDVPVWVVVTGNVRDEPALASRLLFFSELKKNGVVEQVVLSTWDGEYDAHPRLQEIIVEGGFEVVQSPQPEIVCLGHFLHQMVAIDNGLNRCPDRSFILKTRTDKSGATEGFYEHRIRAFLERRNFSFKCRSSVHSQSYKIGLFSPYFEHSLYGPSLCMWHDQSYFGYKSDIQKMINFDVMSFDLYNMAPEQALFGHPLISRFAAFQRYFRSIDQFSILIQVTWNHSRTQVDKMQSFSEKLVENTLFRHALLIERAYINSCFFSMSTGEPINFDTSYRGVDLMSFPDTGEFLSAVFSGIDPAYDYGDDARDLQELIKSYFGIAPRRVPMTAEINPEVTKSLPKLCHDLVR